jgi:hypothetical protein
LGESEKKSVKGVEVLAQESDHPLCCGVFAYQRKEYVRKRAAASDLLCL